VFVQLLRLYSMSSAPPMTENAGFIACEFPG
jgi:hypothetical protein